jgi:hypothetical protein
MLNLLYLLSATGKENATTLEVFQFITKHNFAVTVNHFPTALRYCSQLSSSSLNDSKRGPFQESFVFGTRRRQQETYQRRTVDAQLLELIFLVKNCYIKNTLLEGIF